MSSLVPPWVRADLEAMVGEKSNDCSGLAVVSRWGDCRLTSPRSEGSAKASDQKAFLVALTGAVCPRGTPISGTECGRGERCCTSGNSCWASHSGLRAGRFRDRLTTIATGPFSGCGNSLDSSNADALPSLGLVQHVCGRDVRARGDAANGCGESDEALVVRGAGHFQTDLSHARRFFEADRLGVAGREARRSRSWCQGRSATRSRAGTWRCYCTYADRCSCLGRLCRSRVRSGCSRRRLDTGRSSARRTWGRALQRQQAPPRLSPPRNLLRRCLALPVLRCCLRLRRRAGAAGLVIVRLVRLRFGGPCLVRSATGKANPIGTHLAKVFALDISIFSTPERTASLASQTTTPCRLTASPLDALCARHVWAAARHDNSSVYR